MDFLKKHNFWVICGVLTVVGLGGWIWTMMDMSARFDADKAKIESALGTINGVKGIQNHPNKSTHDQMDARILALKKSVKSAWQEQYDLQSGIFLWPSHFPPEMNAALRKLRPIEEKVPFPTPPDQEVLLDWRTIYSNYIDQELPKLADTIGAKWQVTPGAAGASSAGYGGGGYDPSAYTPSYSTESGVPGAVEEERPVVDWAAANQQEIYNVRFNWASRPNAAPNTLQMLYAQEDFWTLQSIMDIIQRTNGDADAYYEAIVKEIQFIRIGAGAVPSDAKITSVLAAAGGPGMEGSSSAGMEGASGDPYAQSGGPALSGMPMPGSDSASGYGPMSAAALDAIDPANGRYVDNAYKPLTAEELRGSLTTTDPEKTYLAVAKRMPVRLRLKMDQRHLNRLLIECANAPLTLEVRQVRINPGTSGAISASGGMSAPTPGLSGGFGGGFGGGAESMPSAPSYDSSGSSMGPQVGGSFDTVIEIYGIVYIYNPVAEKPLDVGEAVDSETTPVPEPVEATLTSVTAN